jgi:hypothetical protein
MQMGQSLVEGWGVVDKESVIKGVVSCQSEGNSCICRHNAMRCGGDRGLSRRWKETVNNNAKRRENAIDRERDERKGR